MGSNADAIDIATRLRDVEGDRYRRLALDAAMMIEYLSKSDDLHAIIADQAETIDQLRAALTQTEREHCDDPYWSGVYDQIRSAWDAWAFAELGTASPTPLDLEGRPELAALWESLK